jgi:hypothetical protein
VVSLILKVRGLELKGAKKGNTKSEYLSKYKFADESVVSSMTGSLKDGELFGEIDQGSAVLKATDKQGRF